MVSVVRVEGLAEEPWLARFTPIALDWWLIRSSNPAGAGDPRRELARARERVVSVGGGTSGAWVARVEGPSEAVLYATTTVPGDRYRVDTARRSRWAVLVDLETLGTLALLDASDTVDVGLALFRVARADAAVVAEALSGDVPALGGVSPNLVVLRPPGVPWCIVGARDDQSSALAAVADLVADGTESLPSRPSVSRRTPHGPRMVALLVGIVALGSAAAGIAAWRLTQHAASRSAAPLVGLAPCIGGPFTTASGLPSPSDGTVATDEAPGLAQVLLLGEDPAATTWLWVGQRWQVAHTSASPPSRGGAAAAYDPVMRGVLLFGGSRIRNGASVALNDTWAWNGCTWLQVAAQGPAPSGSLAPVMAWDRSTNRMVLLTAGDPTGADAMQTWTWSGSRWQLAAPASRSPVGSDVVMAFDPVMNAVIAVRLNGIDNDPSAPSTTWWWDGSDWHLLHPSHPPALGSPAALVLDPSTNHLLLVGPRTWMWGGHDWTVLQPNTDEPAVPLAAVDNEADGAAEVFGWDTQIPSMPTLALWVWSGSTWVRLADGSVDTRIPGASPPARQFASTAYDIADHQLVLFGGNGAPPGIASPMGVLNTPLLDTWIFDGNKWMKMSVNDHPPTRGPMVFDPFSGNVLLVANPEFESGPPTPRPPPDQTWTWNGSSWRYAKPQGEPAASVVIDDMVADPATRTVVAVASCCAVSRPPTATQTWTWNGSTWSELQPKTELPAGLEFVMAYDPHSQRVIVVGNDGAVGPATTWAWDGNNWTALQPKNGALFDPVTATIATDPVRQTLVMLTTLASIQHTEVWNGSFWVDHAGTGPSGADTGYQTGAMYYDNVLHGILLLSSSTDDFSERWMWTGQSWLQLAA